MVESKEPIEERIANLRRTLVSEMLLNDALTETNARLQNQIAELHRRNQNLTEELSRQLASKRKAPIPDEESI